MQRKLCSTTCFQRNSWRSCGASCFCEIGKHFLVINWCNGSCAARIVFKQSLDDLAAKAAPVKSASISWLSTGATEAVQHEACSSNLLAILRHKLLLRNRRACPGYQLVQRKLCSTNRFQTISWRSCGTNCFCEIGEHPMAINK